MRFSTALLSMALCAALPVSLQAQDASAWTGFYAGASLSRGDGYIDFGGGDDRDAKGSAYGIHAGYLWGTGAWAYGIEASYAKADIAGYFNDIKLAGQGFANFTDFKARLGYAVGRTLVYGVVGYGMADWEEAKNNLVFENRGPLFGIGVDVLASERVALGIEVLRRDLENQDIAGVDDPFLDTVSLRVSYNF